MTNKEIFKKAIEKAVNKGYKPVKNLGNSLFDATCDMLIIKDLYHTIIFSHDFAKIFFSCDHKCKPYKSGSFFDECEKCGEICPIGGKWYTWKDHLKNMVILEEPLKYLEKFLLNLVDTN